MSSPSPKSPEQSDKSRKYDRQIRLWGEHGQSKLEVSNVCLVNSTALGCEILKGLVLPGIGGFTIVDSKLVSEEDFGINFFLDSSLIGQPRAIACMKLLQELNPDVHGDYVDESVDYLLDNKPAFYQTFDVVIATNLNEITLVKLSNYLWDINVPFIYCRSLGFLGSIRLQLKEHCVVEVHPDNRQYDLRLEHPFETLKQHLENTKVTNKVPWLVVLYKYLQQWKAEHDNQIPNTYKEKTELKELIRKGMSSEQENFEEAIKAVNTSFGGGVINYGLKKIIDDNDCINLHKQSNPFWIMTKALREFITQENNGFLPQPGVLPDMTADTESYINLQNIYRQQAQFDAGIVTRKCQNFLRELGLPEDTISEESVRLFCREAAGLTVLRGSKIAHEYEKNTTMQTLADELEDQGSLVEHYVALRAYERFFTECGNIPGECGVENDTSRLKTIASKILSDCNGSKMISDDIIHEICRYGGAEIHSISSFIGGCVAHEVIKIITKQYKPIDNTFIYNGITSETTTFKL